ncbi:MAG: PKD domain-containing protein [Steroidobacteraceae bacterium]
MRYKGTGLIVAGMAALLVLNACGGGGGAAPTPNTAPIARAGSAQSVSAGAPVTLNGSASSDADGSIAGYAWTQTAGTSVTLTGASTAGPSFVAPQVVNTSTLTFSLVVTDNVGALSAASSVTITVNAPVIVNVTVAGTVRFARVTYRSTSPFGLDYANPVLRPARGVAVRAIDAGTLAVLATGVTDASGAYSLTVTSNATIAIQVVAQMQRAGTPRWDVRVQNGLTGTAPYTYASAAFSSNVGTKDIDIPTGIPANGSNPPSLSDRASGPFAILDTIFTAIQAVVAVAPSATFPELLVDWGVQTDGSQFSTAAGGVQYIQLLADLGEDADEFDQHTVAHEFGHFVEHNFSRSDNRGGSHSLSDRLDMRTAFGEGFGYGFAAIVLNDPVVRDGFVNTLGQQVSGSFNAETNPPSTGAGAGCWCSEISVVSILWDLYDSVSDGSDNISLGFAPIWAAMTGDQRNTPAFTSIFSFITALKAAQPGSAALINTLVAAQNINAASIDAFATAETNAPFPNMLPLYANITRGGGPVIVRSIDDGGHFNKAGNGGLLRFVATSTGPVTVTLTTSNPAVNSDPDFFVQRSGILVALGDDGAPQPETETFNVTAGTTYVINAYDCANGCDTVQGTPGDYDLTVTIN